jgi:hypothetical protein
VKYLKLSSVALLLACAIPVMAADPSSKSGVNPTVQPTQQAQQAQPTDPKLPADLFVPKALERGLPGPCSIRVTCTCTWGTTFVACSGQQYCVGGNAVTCDGQTLTCATVCSRGGA